jgi:hypothetical protein
MNKSKATRNSHGGRRNGAGRPKVYSMMERVAIYYRVSEVRKAQGLTSNNAAIKFLQAAGELPPNISNLQRYINPAQLDRRVIKVLAKAPARVGILSLIPRPSATRKKKI